MSEIWDGPGDNYHPGSDDDEDAAYIQEDGDNSPQMIADRRADDHNPGDFTTLEWAIKENGKCCYQTSYGIVTPTSYPGHVGYCEQPSWPGDVPAEFDGLEGLGYCQDHTFPAFAEAVEMICGTCPHQVFYRSDDDYPQAILIHDDSESIVRVNYDGSYESAYLINEPPKDAAHCCMGGRHDEIKGFAPGWEC